MRIGIKIGSSLLTEKERINQKFLGELCRQIRTLVHQGQQVFLVTSGAVASDPTVQRSKNLRAAVGWAKLITDYQLHFKTPPYPLTIAPILVTDRELVNDHRIVKAVIIEAMTQKVLPIINANDAIDSKELKLLDICADNDPLFTLLCEILLPQLAIIGFDQPGLLNPDKKVIYQVAAGELKDIIKFAKEGSHSGHGEDGMKTKLQALASLAQKGIRAILAPGHENNFILRTVKSEKSFGTIFEPIKQPIK